MLLNAQNPASATDMYNTADGYNAGQQLQHPYKNTFIGANAGDAIQQDRRITHWL